MKYIKDNQIIKSGDSIIYNGFKVINPKNEDYLKAGYEVYEEPEVEVVEPTEEELLKQEELRYSNEVERLIRERYSLSNELSIHRQREVKIQEFDEYFSYCEECKAKALTIINTVDVEEV